MRDEPFNPSVILSEAKDLLLGRLRSRSFAPLRMTSESEPYPITA